MLQFSPWEICTGPECEKRILSQELCAGHLQQLKRGEELRPLKPKATVDPVERFWSSVEKTVTCWIWTGNLSDSGHGIFNYRGGPMRAHRFAWEILGNPVPKVGWFHPTKNPTGWVLDHDSPDVGCGSPACVNPGHLAAVPKVRNQERRRGAQKNHQSSSVRNVYWDSRSGKWKVQVLSAGTYHWGGLHDSVEAADRAAVELRARVFAA